MCRVWGATLWAWHRGYRLLSRAQRWQWAVLTVRAQLPGESALGLGVFEENSFRESDLNEGPDPGHFSQKDSGLFSVLFIQTSLFLDQESSFLLLTVKPHARLSWVGVSKSIVVRAKELCLKGKKKWGGGGGVCIRRGRVERGRCRPPRQQPLPAPRGPGSTSGPLEYSLERAPVSFSASN